MLGIKPKTLDHKSQILYIGPLTAQPTEYYWHKFFSTKVHVDPGGRFTSLGMLSGWVGVSFFHGLFVRVAGILFDFLELTYYVLLQDRKSKAVTLFRNVISPR